MRKIVYLTLFLFAAISAFSQDEFLIFGNIKTGSPQQEVTIAIRNTQRKKDTVVADANGDYKIFLKYGEDYSIKFLSNNKMPLKFKCLLKLPSYAKQCCYTPLNMSFRMFDKGQPTDSLFIEPIHSIKYENRIHNFNYSVDVDFLVEQRKVEAQMEKQRKAYNKKRQKEIEDSMRIESRYMSFIERGNLYFKAKNYTKAKEMYLASLEVKPEREYPKYKMEDIKTEVTLFNAKNIDTATIAYKEKPLVQPKKEKPRKTYTYLSSEDIDKLIQADIERHIKKNTNSSDSVKAAVALFNKTIEEADSTFMKPKETPKAVAKTKPIVQEPAVEEAIEEPIVDEAANDFEIVEIDTLIEDNDTAFSEHDMPAIEAPVEQFNYEEYQDSLKEIYVNERTIEITKTEEKTTTKVIINKNNKITIYLKVNHNWGGIYYFIETTPKTLENISNAYFHTSTGLKDEEKEGVKTDSINKNN